MYGTWESACGSNATEHLTHFYYYYYYYYYIRLMAFFQDNLGKLAPER